MMEKYFKGLTYVSIKNRFTLLTRQRNKITKTNQHLSQELSINDNLQSDTQSFSNELKKEKENLKTTNIFQISNDEFQMQNFFIKEEDFDLW